LADTELQKLLDQGVEQGAAPAAVLALWPGQGPAVVLAAGLAGPETVFDLASLTKPLAAAALAAELGAAGLLPWDEGLGELWGEGVPADKARITVRQLLTHASGLPAHRPYYTVLEGRPAPVRRGLVKAMLLNEPLEAAPGERALYSDLGYMLLGLLLEDHAGQTLDRAVTRLYDKLGVEGPRFLPLGQEPPWPRRAMAPSGPLPGRPEVHGQVEDENAFALGGVAGHAGLFGTAAQAAAVMDALCRAAAGAGPWPAAWAARLFARDAATPGSGRTPGFDTPGGPDSAAGENAPPDAVGHLGFTGASLWWRPAANRGVVLLTNRVALGRDNRRIHELRRRVHAAAWRWLER
jgi:CubicO group peptidase (beta-lactamase class C family)